jgi:hypothetical protein
MSTPSLVLDAVATVEAAVYSQHLPPGATLPCLVISEVAYAEGPFSRDGLSGWDRPRWQFDCWAETYQAARTLATEVQAALRSSDLGARIVGRVDLPEPEMNLFRVVVDATLWTPMEIPESPES